MQLNLSFSSHLIAYDAINSRNFNVAYINYIFLHKLVTINKAK